MNRRFTFRGLLGLVLIVISSFLGYNWLTGGSAERKVKFELNGYH
jgi:hypothetical protein